MNKSEFISRFLRKQVESSRGCTEVGVISLSTSLAYNALIGYVPRWLSKSDKTAQSTPLPEIDSIAVTMDRNVYKNALSVGIPNARGSAGIELAAALGIYCNPDKKLELLSDVDDNILREAQRIVESGKVSNKIKDNWTGNAMLSITSTVRAGRRTGTCKLHGGHTNVVSIQNGDTEIYKNVQELKGEENEVLRELKGMKIADLVDLVIYANAEDIEFIHRGIRMNREAAAQGLEKRVGLSVGKTIQELVDEGRLPRGIISYAQIITAAAADARMAGENVPVTTSAGSGNQGIIVSNPLCAIHEIYKHDKRKLAESVLLGHLVTSYAAAYTGSLSALCGCVIRAGIGSTAGVTYYFGGNPEQIGNAINHTAANITGVICDGAKGGCAEKLSTSASTSIMSAFLALKGIKVPSTNGIIGKTPEETIRNIGEISKGMIHTDKVIVEIMNKKQR